VILGPFGPEVDHLKSRDDRPLAQIIEGGEREIHRRILDDPQHDGAARPCH
jgi:hypothetical protein